MEVCLQFPCDLAEAKSPYMNKLLRGLERSKSKVSHAIWIGVSFEMQGTKLICSICGR